MTKRTIELDPECSAHLAIDAINRFCREVLVKRGLLRIEALDDADLDKEKYRIASELAEAWKSVEVDD